MTRKIDLAAMFTKSEAIRNSNFSLSNFQYANALESSGFLHDTIKVFFCLGHSRSVDCLAVDSTKQYVASGSFDSELKIWSANLSDVDDAVKTTEEGSSESKKAKKAPTRTPLVTLTGHKEGIAGVTWLDSATEVVSASWDHTIRIWDAEMQSLKTELVGNKAFFDVAYSPEKKMLLTAASERTIRMYDPRSTEGLIVKSAYSSHQVCIAYTE